jgi:hypothetical protein
MPAVLALAGKVLQSKKLKIKEEPSQMKALLFEVPWRCTMLIY